jgi:hypothetical protein
MPMGGYIKKQPVILVAPLSYKSPPKSNVHASSNAMPYFQSQNYVPYSAEIQLLGIEVGGKLFPATPAKSAHRLVAYHKFLTVLKQQ